MIYSIHYILYIIFGFLFGAAAVVIGILVAIGGGRIYFGCFVGLMFMLVSTGAILFLLLTGADFATGMPVLALVAAVYALAYQVFK